VLHGSFSYLLQDAWGQVTEAHSVSAGLDYPGVGPEHAWLRDSGRADYTAATDAEALAAFKLTAELEGIIPALESAHALAYVLRGPARRGPARRGQARRGPARGGDPTRGESPVRFAAGDVVIVNLSGRGDKDVHEVATLLEGSP